jgi:uncharacterized protein YjiS (DUF1127 family)
MASFDTTRTTYGVSSFANRAVAYFADLGLSVVSWNDERVTRNSLSGLTDRELADIGLVRGEIDAIARSNLIR